MPHLIPSVLLAVAVAASPAAALPQANAGAEPLERRVSLMGTWLTTTVEAEERANALAASELAVAALAATERRLSTWRPESELSRLNATPVGTTFTASPLLSAELRQAIACWQETAGAFDPGIGSLLALWGLRDGGRAEPPPPAELAAVAGVGISALADEGGDRWRRLDVRLRVEEGGFGKGAGLDRAGEALAAAGFRGRALLNLGGQISVFGGGSWQIAIADPADRSRPVLGLALAAGSVATSGNSEQGITIAGQRRSHLFDPRLGQPVEDFGSLTVVAARGGGGDGLLADCLATGLYVLGPQAAWAWAAAHPGVEVVVLRRVAGRLAAWASGGLSGRLQPLVDGVDMHWVPEPDVPAVAQEKG